MISLTKWQNFLSNIELISISYSLHLVWHFTNLPLSLLPCFCLAGSNYKGLTVNLSQTSEIKGETLTVSPLQKTFTESVLIGENVSTNIQSWWGDQFSQQQQEHENWPGLSSQWVSIVPNSQWTDIRLSGHTATNFPQASTQPQVMTSNLCTF